MQKKECLLIFSSPDCSFRNIILHSTKFPMWLKVSHALIMLGMETTVVRNSGGGVSPWVWMQALPFTGCVISRRLCVSVFYLSLAWKWAPWQYLYFTGPLWGLEEIIHAQDWQMDIRKKFITMMVIITHQDFYYTYIFFWNKMRSNEFYMIIMTY